MKRDELIECAKKFVKRYMTQLPLKVQMGITQSEIEEAASICADFHIAQIDPYREALDNAEQKLESIECLLIRDDLDDADKLGLIEGYFTAKALGEGGE
jgi:hypothetical protein